MATKNGISEDGLEYTKGALNEIAMNCNAISELCTLIIDADGDPESAAALAISARAMASQCGFLADHTICKVFGAPGVLGDAERWLTPPAQRAIAACMADTQ